MDRVEDSRPWLFSHLSQVGVVCLSLGLYKNKAWRVGPTDSSAPFSFFRDIHCRSLRCLVNTVKAVYFKETPSCE